MKRFNRFLAAAFLAAAMLFTGAVAQAMEIRQFDKMAQDDRAEYVARWLIQGAEKVLTDEGRPDLAERVGYLFRTNAPDGNISIGMSDFMLTLAKARLADAKRAGQDPNAPRLEVEHAMIVTLKKNGIVLPKSFMTVGNGFKPKYAPQK